MDCYQILGVDRKCSAAEIHHAFRTISMKMHPDRFPDSDRSRAEKEYQLIVKAYNTLKDERQRAEYDKSLKPAAAKNEDSNTEAQYQQAFKSGVLKYNQKNYDIASELLARAVFVKETAEAHFYKGMSEIRIPRKRKAGLDSLQKATELDSYNGKYLKTYARVLIDYGMVVRAKPVVQRVMELLPGDPEVADLTAAAFPEEKKGGVFSSFLGRFRGDGS